MKKVVSLLLALAIVSTLSMGVFAAEDIEGYDDTTTLRDDYNDLYDDDYDSFDATSYNGRAMIGTTEKDIVLAEGEIFIALDDSKFVPYDYELDPGTEYTFPLYAAKTAGEITGATGITTTNALRVTENVLDGGRIRLRTIRGSSAIASAKIEKKGAGKNAAYNLVIETKDTYGTKTTDVAYSFIVNNQGDDGKTATNGGVTLKEGDASFIVGYGLMSDDDVDYYGEGDIITITNEHPVFTKKQLERIAKAYNYKTIEFEAEDGSWRYTGRVSGMPDTNFHFSHDVLPAVANKFYDQDFKFLTFNAGVTFPTNGEMRIDVSDVSDDWNRIYTYLYRNGSLTPINTTYDGVDDEIVFRTNYLGAFVMTDVEITDTTILNPGTDESSTGSESSTGNQGGGSNTDNPNMGLPSMNLVLALGAVSLAAAGSIMIRKK